MAKKIEKDGVLHAIVQRKEDWQRELDFFTPTEMFLQVGTFWYQEGKQCKPHKHIVNRRHNTLTQECNIVMSGSVRVSLYDNDGRVFHSETLRAGDLMVMVAGAHGFEILEPDSKIVECKNGPFISVEKDKKPI